MEKLFSYGTLQLEEVQLATFNRRLKGSNDKLTGFNLGDLPITCPHVLALSKEPVHKILIPSNNQNDTVEGMVFELTKEICPLAERDFCLQVYLISDF